MTISGVSALGAASGLGLLSPLGRGGAGGNAGRDGRGSFSAPAFLLQGTALITGQGLYNAQGRPVGSFQADQSARAAGKAPPTPFEKKRAAILKAAADKIDNGDPQGGRAEAERLLARNASDITALRLVAVSHLIEKDYKRAEAVYARAASLAPDSQTLRDELAVARTLQKDDREVLTEARRQIATPARRSAGLRLLLHLSRRSPQNADVYLALADGFDSARKPSRVVGALQEALKLADGEQLDEVIARARKLANENPQVGLPRNLLGRALQKAGRFNEALTALKAATDIAPLNGSYRSDLAGAYAARATSTLERRDVASAEADLNIARKIDPFNRDVREASGRVAGERAKRDLDARRYTRVLGRLLTAASQGPVEAAFRKNLSAQFLRAGAYYQTQGDKTLAITSYEKALELDPTSDLARKRTGEVSHDKGLEALNANDLDNAVAFLDKAYQTYRATPAYAQDLARAYDLRGQQRQSAGELDKAIADFEKGFLLDPTNTSLDTNLSNALKQKLTS